MWLFDWIMMKCRKVEQFHGDEVEEHISYNGENSGKNHARCSKLLSRHIAGEWEIKSHD
jgi:hypothetical protein